MAELDAVCATAGDCRADDDKLLAYLDTLAEHAAALRAAVDDAERVELLLADKPTFRTKLGKGPNWPDVGAVRDRIERLGEERNAIATAVTNAALRSVVSFLAERTADARGRAPAARASSSSTTCSCSPARVLRDPKRGAEVRGRLRERYQRLLVDEFQDTDPIQVEIAALLAATEDQALDA